MDSENPMFDPGDQKVIGQGFPTPSSRTANRVYFVLMLGVIGLGAGCLLFAEYVTGVIMFLVGGIAAFFFLRAELSERAMMKRMRRRVERSQQG